MTDAEPKALIEGFQRLSTANVSDGLDRAGIAGAPHGIGPLWDSCGKIVGPAATLKLVPVGEAEESPVLGTLEAVKLGNPGDVLVIDQGGRTDVNSYGGVAGFTTRHFGLVGTVIDGVTRDIDEYKALNLPVYGRGFIQQSIRNRCACDGYGIGVRLGGVPVDAGRHHRRRRERRLRRAPWQRGRGAGARDALQEHRGGHHRGGAPGRGPCRGP